MVRKPPFKLNRWGGSSMVYIRPHENSAKQKQGFLWSKNLWLWPLCNNDTLLLLTKIWKETDNYFKMLRNLSFPLGGRIALNLYVVTPAFYVTPGNQCAKCCILTQPGILVCQTSFHCIISFMCWCHSVTFGPFNIFCSNVLVTEKAQNAHTASVTCVLFIHLTVSSICLYRIA